MAELAAAGVAAVPEVRAELVAFQRSFAKKKPGAVIDGRDIGTVIAPARRGQDLRDRHARGARPPPHSGASGPGRDRGRGGGAGRYPGTRDERDMNSRGGAP